MSAFGPVVLSLAVCFVLLLAVLQVVFEPRRRRLVLDALAGHSGWLPGSEIARQTGLRAAWITLVAMEDIGLLERRPFGDPAGRDRGFLPRVQYRLTGQGRRAAASPAWKTAVS